MTKQKYLVTSNLVLDIQVLGLGCQGIRVGLEVRCAEFNYNTANDMSMITCIMFQPWTICSL